MDLKCEMEVEDHLLNIGEHKRKYMEKYLRNSKFRWNQKEFENQETHE